MPFRFRFRWIPFIAAMIAVAVGLSLGQWQMGRAAEKEAIAGKIAERKTAAPFRLGDGQASAEDLEFRNVVATGEFIDEWPLYLDNRPYKGEAGFYLLMPLKIADSNQHVLVSRGWFPRNPIDRLEIPNIDTPSGTIEVQGVVRRSAGQVLQLGEAPPLSPGAIVQNVDLAEFEKASRLKTLPFVVEQTNVVQDGLVRDWPTPTAGIDKHLGYAFQWYALAATAFIFFLVTGFRRGPQ